MFLRFGSASAGSSKACSPPSMAKRRFGKYSTLPRSTPASSVSRGTDRLRPCQSAFATSMIWVSFMVALENGWSVRRSTPHYSATALEQAETGQRGLDFLQRGRLAGRAEIDDVRRPVAASAPRGGEIVQLDSRPLQRRCNVN